MRRWKIEDLPNTTLFRPDMSLDDVITVIEGIQPHLAVRIDAGTLTVILKAIRNEVNTNLVQTSDSMAVVKVDPNLHSINP